MVKASRTRVKTLTIVKSRDIVVDRLLRPCEDGNHAKCTGWAVLRKEVSPIDVNSFFRCTCAHHHKREHKKIKEISKKLSKKSLKKKPRKSKPVKKSKKNRSGRRARRR
jgi:hypothetical protein